MKTKVLSLGLLVLSWWSILCVPAAACPPDPGDPDPPCCPDGCGACEECIDCSCQWEGPHIAPLYEGNLCVGENMTYVVYIATSGGAYCPWYPVWGGGDDPPIGFGCFYSTHWHTSGVKTVTVDTECGSDEEQVTVVEVASLLPDVGVEIDDGDGDPNTKSFVVCVVDPNYDPNVVTVTATPDPCVPEANLPACWTLTGGIGTSKLVRTVDRTTPGVTTITCTCGSSFKETKIYVVKVDKIEINYSGTSWDDVTGETITVLKGTKYTFRATLNPAITPWPASIFSWSGVASGNGQTIEVTFNSEGTKTLTATLCGSTDPNCCKNVTINVVAPTVYQIGFANDHTLYKTPSAWGSWADGTTLIIDPVYDTDANNKNDSVCVTKNSSTVSLSGVKLKVPQALTYSTTIRVDANGTYNWNESEEVSFSGTTSGAATLGIKGNIINQVKKYDGDFQIQWKYRVLPPDSTNAWNNTGTTSHTVYVTWGTPNPSGSDVTEKRIDCVCNAADGQSSVGGCADAVFNALSGSFDLGASMWGPVPIWRLHNPGEKSQCPGLARYVSRHFRMLGLTDTEVIQYCYATPSGTYLASSSSPGTQWRTIVPGVGHPDPTIHDDDYAYERLAHVDGDGKANAYEATCLFNGYYYALGVGIFTNARDVVKTAFTSIEWQYRVGASPPYTFLTCTEYPWVEAP